MTRRTSRTTCTRVRSKGAFATGPEYVKWLEGAEQQHRDLMAKGGLLKK